MDRKKLRLLILVLVNISLGALGGCVARRAKSAVATYSQVLKPGMTRKEVEDYFRANKIQFSQACCAERSNGQALDDLVEIGTQHFPVPCGDTTHYAAFIFDEQTQHPPVGFMRADNLDTLQSITTFHWADDCF
jgi:hypothetical protein